jgi:hypothetical protein
MEGPVTSRFESGRPLPHLTLIALALALTGLSGTALANSTVVIQGTDDVDDSTLYESTTDGNAGGFVGFFVGLTAESVGNRRRAVIRFDTSSIASDEIVREVSLRLVVERTRGVADTHSLHRITAPWVEGNGTGIGSGGGAGGTAVPGAVTWNSREHLSTPWTTPGGDFAAAASASAAARTAGASVLWADDNPRDGMAADVQSWISDPATNFGWLIRGEETRLLTARRYHSSESAGAVQPTLTITLITRTDVPTDGLLQR